MGLSTESSTPVEYLLGELAGARRENRRLKDKLRRTQASRDRWRTEAWYWKWGAVGKFTHGEPQFIKDDRERRRKGAQR